MPANLGLDNEVNQVTTTPADSVSWSERVVNLIIAALRSDRNPFGSAALRNVGNVGGDLPTLGSDGNVQDRNLPTASTTQRGIAAFATGAELLDANPPTDKMVSPSQVISSLRDLLPRDIGSTAFGGVGSYLLCRWVGDIGDIPAAGQTASGSNLAYASDQNSAGDRTPPTLVMLPPSQTWRRMGSIAFGSEIASSSGVAPSGDTDVLVGLWARVS